MRFVKKLFKVLFISLLGTLLFWLFSNVLVVGSTYGDITADIDEVSVQKVALVLGTSKRRSDGGANQYFANRIASASALYRSGKVKHIIVSGDNGSKFYNEPKDMLAALEAKGIPREHITLDYAGFRTLDSVVRCKEVFGQNRVVIVTQKFHAFRSLFIASFYGIDAEAYIAKDPTYGTQGVLGRELFARTKAVLDLYVFGVKPKFLGKKEVIDI